MSADLVARLRAEADRVFEQKVRPEDVVAALLAVALLREAADELERLSGATPFVCDKLICEHLPFSSAPGVYYCRLKCGRSVIIDRPTSERLRT